MYRLLVMAVVVEEGRGVQGLGWSGLQSAWKGHTGSRR